MVVKMTNGFDMIENKILNLGFPRTGTTSLCQLLTNLRIRSEHDSKELLAHYRQTSEVISYPKWDEFDSYSGALCPMWLDIVENSVDCKFMFTTRDTNTWKVSAKKHFQGGWSSFRRSMFSEVGVPYNDKYIKVYEDYNSSIIKYFKENDLPLLIIDFENDDNLIEKVCEFLGIDHSNIIYKRKIDVPWYNKGDSYQDPDYWKRIQKSNPNYFNQYNDVKPK